MLTLDQAIEQQLAKLDARDESRRFQAEAETAAQAARCATIAYKVSQQLLASECVEVPPEQWAVTEERQLDSYLYRLLLDITETDYVFVTNVTASGLASHGILAYTWYARRSCYLASEHDFGRFVEAATYARTGRC